MDPYEEFRFHLSLIKKIYPTLPNDNDLDDDIIDSKKAKEAMKDPVSRSNSLIYNFFDYKCTAILKKICCLGCPCRGLNCFKRWYDERLFKMKRYQLAVSRLNGETDILAHIATQRLSNFMGKLFLKKYQRALIRNFRKYQLAST